MNPYAELTRTAAEVRAYLAEKEIDPGEPALLKDEYVLNYVRSLQAIQAHMPSFLKPKEAELIKWATAREEVTA